MQKRKLWKDVLLSIITFGIWSYIAFYEELIIMEKLTNNKKYNPTKYLLLSLIPFAGVIIKLVVHVQIYDMLAKINEKNISKYNKLRYILSFCCILPTLGIWHLCELSFAYKLFNQVISNY